jgi:hypothetical protein
LFNGGLERPAVSTIMALGSLFAAGVLVFLKLQPDNAATHKN